MISDRQRVVLGIAVAAVATGGVALRLAERPASAPVGPEAAASTFVGTAACADCHAAELAGWRGSDHDRAMMPASESSVLGDFAGAALEHGGVTTRFTRHDGRFLVETEGPGGLLGKFEVAYTFGVRPLQQYLLPIGGGRMQALSIAWDVERRRWYPLEPSASAPADDWLHWTRGGQNWNGMCASCHSTNLRKGLDAEAATFATTWSEPDVGCEACHGPGSRHVAWSRAGAAGEPWAAAPANSGLVVPTPELRTRAVVERCAYCHARRAELDDHDPAAARLLDLAIPATLAAGVYHADGQQLDEVYTYGSFLQSRMYAKGVGCGDCHDPHRAAVRAPGNALCVRCHNAAGTVLRAGIDGRGLVRRDYDSPAHHFHRAGGAGSACVDCHAPARVYMGIDGRHDHSFRIPRPDLSAATGAPSACETCHADRGPSWSAAAVARWYGEGRRREPHFGEAIAAGRAGAPGAGTRLRSLAMDSEAPAIARATAVELLAGFPGEETARTLRAAAADPEPWLRLAAANALATAGPAVELDALPPLLVDPVRAVRHAAASALAGTPPAALAGDGTRRALAAAIAEYERATRRSLDFPEGGHNLGNLFARLGRAADAEAAYRRAIEVDDRFHPAKVNLAVLVAGQGRLAEAEALLREVVATRPDDADVLAALGLVLAERGDPGAAAGALERSWRLAPAPRTAYNLGLLLSDLGRVDEARAVLESALALAPEEHDLLFALADLELRSGRSRAAAALAARMAAVRPGDPAAARVAEAARALGAARP